jgi:NAD kinase
MKTHNIWSKLKRITFVTKSGASPEATLFPKNHPVQTTMKKETEEHRKNGDIFTEVFTAGTKGLKIQHVPIDEFLEKKGKQADEEGHLICTLGGDGTFLMTAQKIRSSNAFALGINPEPRNSIGQLLGYCFNDKKNIKGAAEHLLQSLMNEKVGVVSRTRVKAVNTTKKDLEYPLGNGPVMCSFERGTRLRSCIQ